MDFEKIVMERYATKEFDGKKLPNGKVSKLLEMIRYAASSFNIQPWKIIVLTDQKTKEKLAPFAWNQAQITTCSHLLVFCADLDILGNIKKLELAMLKGGITAKDAKEKTDILRGFDKKLSQDKDRKLSWAQRQVYLALGNALNGAKSLGFDSCPMEGFDPAAFARTLDLPQNIVPTALCPIGYAKDKPNQKMRLAKEEVFIFDN